MKKLQRKSTDREPLVVTYHPNLPALAPIVRQHWKVMTNYNPRLKRCFKEPSVVAYKRGSNIGDMLFRSKVSTRRSSGHPKPAGFSLCGRACKAFIHAEIGASEIIKTHQCPRTGQVCPSMANNICLECMSCNVN